MNTSILHIVGMNRIGTCGEASFGVGEDYNCHNTTALAIHHCAFDIDIYKYCCPSCLVEIIDKSIRKLDHATINGF